MRELPKVGDRINCDPNRELGDQPDRWNNPNRHGATVIAILDDWTGKVIVFRWWSRARRSWLFRAEHETWWQIDTNWEIGRLKSRAAGDVSRETSRLTKDQ